MTEPSMNGHPHEPTDAELIGDAVAGKIGQLLGQVLPQVFNMLPAMIAQAVQQPQRPRWCSACLVNRLGWEAAHKADMETAMAMAAKMAGLAESDPQAARLDVAPFLPERLRPGSGQAEQMPPVMDAVTMVQGTEFCAGHVPGAPGAQGRSLIVPPPGMPMSMAAALAGRAA